MSINTKAMLDDYIIELAQVESRIINNGFKLRTYALIPHRLVEFEALAFRLEIKRKELMRKIRYCKSAMRIEIESAEKLKLEETIKKLPHYVKIAKCNLYLKLERHNEELKYCKHNSRWCTEFKQTKLGVFTINKEYPHLHKVKLEEVSQSEWSKER